MAAMSRRRLTPIVLHYPPHHGRPPTLSATDNPANTAAWGRACRQKGPARATKYFSGNGVSVAAMGADSSPPNIAYLLSRTARLSSVKKSRTRG